MQSHPSGKELDKLIQGFGHNNQKLAQKDSGKDSSSNSRTPGLAAWFVSNCNSRSGREDMVKQLQEVLQVMEEEEELHQVIQVDVYGHGNCGRSRPTCTTDTVCLELLRSTYKVQGTHPFGSQHFSLKQS